MTHQLRLKHRWEQIGVNTVHRADFQGSLSVAGLVKLGLPVQRHPLFGQWHKLLALAGEGEAMTALFPLKEPEAQFLFQGFQLAGQGGLGDKQCLGRRGDAAVAHNGQKGLHICVGHGVPPYITK